MELEEHKNKESCNYGLILEVVYLEKSSGYDRHEIYDWLVDQHLRGNSFATIKLARLHDEKGEYAKSAEYIVGLVEKGCNVAKNTLGSMYMTGKHFKRILKKH